jgi:hypothetical protein
MPESFVYQMGQVKLEAGEFTTVIKVMVLENDAWNLESKMWVNITGVHSLGPRSAAIGELHRTSLVILNNDDFPQGTDPAKKVLVNLPSPSKGCSLIRARAQLTLNSRRTHKGMKCTAWTRYPP